MADGNVGKREFVRALSVDENDEATSAARAVAVGAGGGGGGGGAAESPKGPAAPKVDLRYTLFNPEVDPAGWWEPTSDHLAVRDVNYLKDHKKIKSESTVFDCVMVECFQVHKPVRKILHLAARPESHFRHSVHKKAPPGTPYKGAPGSHFTFVVHFQVPGYGLCMYFQRKAGEELGGPGGGEPFEAALKAFMEGDIDYKSRHLKFFPVVTEGSWIVRKVVGGKPAIIAKKIDCEFFEGDNYFEVDIDVSSSSVAKSILRVVKSYAKNVSFDAAWGFEGKIPEHLPERIMGIARFEHIDVEKLAEFPVTEEDVTRAEEIAALAKK